MEFHRAIKKHYLTGYRSGRGGGKTHAGAQQAIVQALKVMPGSTGGVVAPTYTMLHDFPRPEFLKILPPELIIDFNKSEDHIIIETGKGRPSHVYFRGADKPDKVRGGNWDWAWFEEASICKAESLDIALACLRGSCPEYRDLACAWFTYTGKGPNAAVEKILAGPDATVIQGTSMDNPHLTERFLNMLKERYSGAFYRQEVLGELVKFEGLIYPVIEDETHQAERSVQEMVRFVAGEDHGYEHPWVFIVAGQDSDGAWHFFEEIHQSHVTPDKRIDQVLELMRRYPLEAVRSPDDRPEMIQAYINAGIPTIPYKRDVDAGIPIVAQALAIRTNGKPGATFSAAVPKTYSQMKQYQWQERPKGQPPKPLKVEDDGPDAVRSLIHGEAQGAGHTVSVTFVGWSDSDELD